MIREDADGYVAECDECFHSTEGVVTGQTDAGAFAAGLRDIGWVVRPDEDGGPAVYCCEECAG